MAGGPATQALRDRVAGRVRENVMELCNGAVEFEFNKPYRFVVTVGQRLAEQAGYLCGDGRDGTSSSLMAAIPCPQPDALKHAVHTVPHLLAQIAPPSHPTHVAPRAGFSASAASYGDAGGRGSEAESYAGGVAGGALGMVGALGSAVGSAVVSLLQLGRGAMTSSGGSGGGGGGGNGSGDVDMGAASARGMMTTPASAAASDAASGVLRQSVQEEALACINACCNALPGLASHLVNAASASIEHAQQHFVAVIESLAGVPPHRSVDRHRQCYHVRPRAPHARRIAAR